MAEQRPAGKAPPRGFIDDAHNAARCGQSEYGCAQSYNGGRTNLDVLFAGEDPDPRQPVCFPSLEALDSSKIGLWSTTQFRLIAVMAKDFRPSTCQSFPDFPVGGLGIAQTL